MTEQRHTMDTHAILANWKLEQALYREARLLDEEMLTEWLEMTTEDVVYQMPLTSRRFRKDRAAPLAVGAGYVFNESRERLALRIKRLQSGYVWAEDPRNHVRRQVSNVEILAGDKDDERIVHSVISIHRCRIDSQTRLLIGGRRDVWRHVTDQWRLARREISLDHSTVPDTNLNVFF
jgi:ethylbenzene dioxygenase subunit beta